MGNNIGQTAHYEAPHYVIYLNSLLIYHSEEVTVNRKIKDHQFH
jgi:hypothetical protein